MIILRLLILMAFVCFLASCGRKEKITTNGDDTSAILATVGDERITAAEFQAEWNRRGFRKLPVNGSEDARRRLLGEMIQTKAALARARESGFDRRPETVTLVENLIVARYREETFAEQSDAIPAIPDAAVSEHYSNNLSRFTIPEAVRAGVITLKVGSKADASKREALLARAESLRDRAAQSTDAEFNELVRQHSEDQSTRYIGGDTGWLVRGSSHPTFPDGVVKAIFKLQAPGAVAPVIETPEAFLVIRLTDRRAATVRPFTEVEPAIRYELAQLQRREREQTYLHELTNGLTIEVNQTALNQIQLPADSEPSAPPALPGN